MGRLRPHIWTLVLATQLLAAGAAQAVKINSSFESGLTGWTVVGDVSVVDASFGVAPTDGSFQLLMTNGPGAVSTAATEAAMGLGNNAIRAIFNRRLRNPGLSTGSGPIEGSAFQQSFFAEAGDFITFDWNFLTDELVPPSQPDLYTDFLWGVLEQPGQDAFGVLAHANQDPNSFVTSNSVFNDETGYQTFTFTFTRTGNHRLTLGVHDVEDPLVDTGAIFDNFRFVKGPEPDTFLLLGMGLAGLAWTGRRGSRA